MSEIPVITSADIAGKKVFVRGDLNVPLADGRVADETRLKAILPTLRYIISNGGSVILASHLGRPGGVPDSDLSLSPVADMLEKFLNVPVLFAPDCVGKRVETMSAGLKSGQVLLLENLRFHPEEKDGDPDFAGSLAKLADIYVNDAFGTCHRNHASMTGVPAALGCGFAGFLVERELKIFSDLLDKPEKPFSLLLGGAKVSDKIDVIENLLERIDCLMIGGGMAFTFLSVFGYETGTSLLEKDKVKAASDIMDSAREKNVVVLLPVDVVVASSSDDTGSTRTVDVRSIPADKAGLDIGPETVQAFSRMIEKSGTVVWNGPMGLFEVPPFDSATRKLVLNLAEATKRGTRTIVGGGDSVRAVTESGMEGCMSFVSTGGGASLKLLQGKNLIAISALMGG